MWVWIVIAGIAFLLLAAGIFGTVAYRMAFYMPTQKRGKDPHAMPKTEQYQKAKPITDAWIDALEGAPCEQVQIVSYDHKKLYGRYYENCAGAPVHILFHGYRSTALGDGCGSYRMSRAGKYNVLLVDQRAHGKSEGRTITFGIKERYDCLSWANYVADRFGKDTPVILFGLSMGAATVLLASALELPANVKGIIADCGYSSAEKIIAKVCAQMHVPPCIALPFLRSFARVFGGFSLKEGDVCAAVAKTTIPLLLIHGQDDRYVPCEMCEEIVAACQTPPMVLRVADAGHGLSYPTQIETYEETIRAFLQRVMP